MKHYLKFYETDIWKLAYELQKKIFEMAVKFPSYEKFGLTSQMNNSSNSVVANIAEADGRYHFADKIRVLYIVRGEIQETQSHLIVAESRKYVSREATVICIKEYENLKRKLNGQINDFIRKKDL